MPDGTARGSSVGLTEGLEAYFYKQLETRRLNSGRGCPGEEVCALTGPLRDKSRPIEAICAGCPLKATKPGAQPGHLSAPIIETLRLDDLKQAGATFAYPDALSPLGWAGLRALQGARAKDQEKDWQQRRKSQDEHSEQARLEARLGRG